MAIALGVAMRMFLYSFLLLAVASTGGANALESGCATRGGPGWRTTEGHCVGWDALPKKCGFPPEKGCSFEGAAFAHAVPPGATREIWSTLRDTFHRLGARLKKAISKDQKSTDPPKQ